MGDFALTDLEGRTVKLSHYRGSVVVVNFWATWCEPCKQELPFLDAYYRELASQGFVVLAIATDGPRTIPGVRQLVKQRGWTFPVLLDSDGAVMGDLNPRGAAPYTMYVDRLGRLAGDHDGYAPGDELGMRAKIQALLEEGKVPESEEKSEASVRVTNSLMVERRTVDAGTYGLLTDRLNLQGAAGNLTTFARADTMVFQDAPSARFQDDARLERLRVRYRLGDWNLIAGDFFEQLGRGIMLSVRKVDELGVDLEIRGGRLEYDGKALGAMLFVGRMNPANLDIVSEQFVEDTDDVLAGGRLSVRAIPGMEVGVLGLHLRPTEQFLADPDALGITQKDQATAGGIFAEVPDIAGLFSLYVEGDFQRRIVAAEHSDGKAVYGTLGLHLPQLNVLAEGMYLDELPGDRQPQHRAGTGFFLQPGAHPRAPRPDRRQRHRLHRRPPLPGALLPQRGSGAAPQRHAAPQRPRRRRRHPADPRLCRREVPLPGRPLAGGAQRWPPRRSPSRRRRPVSHRHPPRARLAAGPGILGLGPPPPVA
jgi:thiol-disulfide isomerase/thioredoxin